MTVLTSYEYELKVVLKPIPSPAAQRVAYDLWREILKHPAVVSVAEADLHAVDEFGKRTRLESR
jgi:hypothetical protein